jgi:hypothetical protein
MLAGLTPMSERDSRPSTPALPPPAPHPGDAPDDVLVPPLEPPPSSLSAIASRRKKEPPREPKFFWVILVVLFVAGTLITFYLQRPR